MKSNRQAWNRIVAAARPAHEADLAGDTSAPYGFATRVAALGLASPRVPGSAVVFARQSLRVFGLASALAVVAVTLSLGQLTEPGAWDGSEGVAPLAAVPDAPEAAAAAVSGEQSPSVPPVSASAEGMDDDAVSEVVNLTS